MSNRLSFQTVFFFFSFSIMYAYPAFRRESARSPRLLMAPSEEAKSCENVGSGRAQTKEEVLAEARTFVSGHGGDPDDMFLILAHCKLQFGKYQGQRFRWLLENSLGYALYLVHSITRERVHATPLSENKQLLLQYTSGIREMKEELEKFQKKQEMQSKARETGDQGCLMVEFGDFKGRSMKEVYDDQSKEAQALIRYLATANARPNTNMAIFKAYVLERRRSAPSASSPAASSASAPAASSASTATRASAPAASSASAPAASSASVPPPAGAWKPTTPMKALLARGKHLSPSKLARKILTPVKHCE